MSLLTAREHRFVLIDRAIKRRQAAGLSTKVLDTLYDIEARRILKHGFLASLCGFGLVVCHGLWLAVYIVPPLAIQAEFYGAIAQIIPVLLVAVPLADLARQRRAGGLDFLIKRAIFICALLFAGLGLMGSLFALAVGGNNLTFFASTHGLGFLLVMIILTLVQPPAK